MTARQDVRPDEVADAIRANAEEAEANEAYSRAHRRAEADQ